MTICTNDIQNLTQSRLRSRQEYQQKKEEIREEGRDENTGSVRHWALLEINELNIKEAQEAEDFAQALDSLPPKIQWEALLETAYKLPELFPNQPVSTPKIFNIENVILDFLNEKLPGCSLGGKTDTNPKLVQLIRALVGGFVRDYLLDEDSPEFQVLQQSQAIAQLIPSDDSLSFPTEKLNSLIEKVTFSLPESLDDVLDLVAKSAKLGKSRIVRLPNGEPDVVRLPDGTMSNVAIARQRLHYKIYSFADSRLQGKNLSGKKQKEYSKIPLAPLVRLLLFRFCSIVYEEDFSSFFNETL